MKTEPTPLDGVLIIEPRVFADDRGFLSESYNKKAFADATGFDGNFVQDNHSRSGRGVVRGMHYQLPPDEQGKLVRCIRGEVFDVAVDIRRSSPTFGDWAGALLSEENHRQLWVPAGFAHGFMATSDVADVLYKTTTYYAPDSERSIRWDDPTIGIEWPDVDVDPILNERDLAAPGLDQADTFS
ncbi:MAG: dTDP-4-dehydrorhamnose 3,5-epimerase [Acidobacteria bacterium]|nr:dTDP-4-dehydrorhamnose 3,5-epimerase [Acidobacteriota bacterium]